MKAGLKDLFGAYASEEETFEAIRQVFKEEQYLIDTHTAVAYTAYKKYLEETKDKTTTVIASTASPYKFNSAVMGAVDSKYKEVDEIALINEMCKLSGVDIPKAVKDIEKRQVLHKKLCSKDHMKKVVKEIIFKN
jgi:threonine synthase